MPAFEGEEDISSKGSDLDMKFSVDLDTNKQDEELMMKLNESVDEALFSKASFTKSKKLPKQEGVRDDGELCKDFPFSKRVSLKVYCNTLGLRRMKKDETLENPNTNTDESEMKKKDVISPKSFFQPGNFDASKFAEQVLESSYEIFENKESEEDMIEEVMDLSSKSSSFYRDEVQSKLDTLNAAEGCTSDRDTSVNAQSYTEYETNDIHGHINKTVFIGGEMNINMDMPHETTKQDDLEEAENTLKVHFPIRRMKTFLIWKLQFLQTAMKKMEMHQINPL